jgi:hypothetical protein
MRWLHRHPRASVSAVALLLVVSLTPSALAAPLVADGDFEDPVVVSPGKEFHKGENIGAWTVEDGTLALGAYVPTAAPNGPQYVAFNLGPGDTPGVIYQDLSTSAGARYHLRFAYAADWAIAAQVGCEEPDRIKRFAVVWGTQTVTYAFDTTGHGEGNVGWTYADLLVDAPTATTRLKFQSLHEGNCGNTIDDVSATAPGPAETGTSLTSSKASSVWGEPVTLTATVIGAVAGTAPAGAVQFKRDGTAIGGPVTLDADGCAAVTTSTLAPGAHTIEADYQPASAASDPSHAELQQSVAKGSTATTVTVAPDPTVAGQAAHFTATVKALSPSTGTPAGTVQFTEEDGTPIDDPQPLDTAGRVTLEASAGAGSYRVKALYGGDEHFAPSGGSVAQVVRRADTTTQITSSPNPVTPGGTVVFTATVRTRAPGDVAPSGAVVFTANGEAITEPIPLDALDDRAGQLAVEFGAPEEARTDTIGASYLGDQDTNPSADSLRQTIAAASGPPATPTPAAASVPSARKQLSATLSGWARTLKRRGLRALARLTAAFAAPAPGTLEVRVYSPSAPRATAQAARKRALIATARRRFKRAGAATVRLKLTAAGRRAVRRATRRAKSLKLAIVARFTPRTGAATTVSKTVAVRPKRRSAARSQARWLPTRAGAGPVERRVRVATRQPVRLPRLR